MSGLRKQYNQAIAKILDDAESVTGWEFVPGGKHRKLLIHGKSRSVKLPVPWSPSDRRGVLNLMSQLRRIAASLCVLVSLVGCSDFRPVIDLKASGPKAQDAQLDEMHCGWLAERYDLDEETAMRKCLSGRGHSVLN